MTMHLEFILGVLDTLEGTMAQMLRQRRLPSEVHLYYDHIEWVASHRVWKGGLTAYVWSRKRLSHGVRFQGIWMAQRHRTFVVSDTDFERAVDSEVGMDRSVGLGRQVERCRSANAVLRVILENIAEAMVETL